MRFGVRPERHSSYISISSSIVPSTRIAESSARLLTRARPFQSRGVNLRAEMLLLHTCDRGLLCSAR